MRGEDRVGCAPLHGGGRDCRGGGQGARPARIAAPALESALTERQRDVLALLVRGLCNKEIAALLGLAEPTVKLHLARVYRALGVGNRVAAQQRALALGLVATAAVRGG